VTWVRSCKRTTNARCAYWVRPDAVRLGFVRRPCGTDSVGQDAIGSGAAHDTHLLTMVPCFPHVHGKDGYAAALKARRVPDYGNSFNPDSRERALDRRTPHTRPATRHRPKARPLAAQLETGRLRIINTPMGRELIAELNSFEVDFTPAGTCALTCARRITTAT
jgi:hypothetical protein